MQYVYTKAIGSDKTKQETYSADLPEKPFFDALCHAPQKRRKSAQKNRIIAHTPRYGGRRPFLISASFRESSRPRLLLSLHAQNWYHPNTTTSSSPPCSRSKRPLAWFLMYRVKRKNTFTSYSLRIVEASGLKGRGGRDDLVLLLHELLAGSLDGDGETELGGVLGASVSKRFHERMMFVQTYLGVVQLTSEGHADRRRNDLLEQAANLTLRVDLRAEDGARELILGTKGSDTLLRRSAEHGVTTSKLQVDINTSLHLVGQTPPVAALKTALGQKLHAGNPVVTLVLSGVAESRFGTHATAGLLQDTLQTESETGSDGLQVGTNEHSGEAALEYAGVDALDASAEVGAGVVLLERDLGSARACGGGRLDLDLRLEAQAVGDALVETTREREVGVKLGLAEGLRK